MDSRQLSKQISRSIDKLKDSGAEPENLYLSKEAYYLLAEDNGFVLNANNSREFKGLQVYYKIGQEEAFEIE